MAVLLSWGVWFVSALVYLIYYEEGKSKINPSSLQRNNGVLWEAKCFQVCLYIFAEVHWPCHHYHGSLDVRLWGNLEEGFVLKQAAP